MATVTGFTAAHMQALANANIVGARISGDNLILTKRDGTDVNVGKVKVTTSDMSPVVEAAINNSATILAAINAATPVVVQNEMNTKSLLPISPLYDSEVAFGITDGEGRRSWLEMGFDGKPTVRSASLIADKIKAPIEAALNLQDMNSDITDLAFAIVDKDGRRTDIELDKRGKLTDRVVLSLKDRMATIVPDLDVDRVVCSGDSMTGGAGGVPYPTQLANLTGWPVVNYGVGGETSTTIAGRLGGRPMLATIPSGYIPADTSAVEVTLLTDSVGYGTDVFGNVQARPLLQQKPDFNPVTFAGVSGSLEVLKGVDGAPDIYRFSRSAAGSQVRVNKPEPIIPMSSTKYKKSIHVLWWGHNDGPVPSGQNYADATDIIAREKAFIETLVGPNPRYVVMNLVQNQGSWRKKSDLQFLRAFGRRMINLADYLSSDAAFEDAGLLPSEADTTAIGLGQIPPSFRIDSIHLTEVANGLVAKQVAARIREFGWKP